MIRSTLLALMLALPLIGCGADGEPITPGTEENAG
jgi:predicted small lipoprotein YifL